MPSKRFKEASKKIDKTKTYSVEEAAKLVKETSNVKFDATIEVHCRLGIDVKQSDQQIRGTYTLLHSLGKEKIVAAFVDPDKEAEAKEAGADIIGNQEYIDELAQKGKINFDVAIATPTMMPKLAKAAKILGPRGLMPNPKEDTVGANITKMITDQKTGKMGFKNDKTGNVHAAIGKASMKEEQIVENFNAFMETLNKMRPAASKGIFVKSCTVTSSMGPGIKIEL